MRDGVVRLVAGDRRGARDAASLHRELLPTSSVVRLGDGFMRRFYYDALIADGLVLCDVAYHRDVPAGFIAWTGAPASFMSQGRRRHPLLLPWVLAGALVTDPRRVVTLAQVAGLTRRRAATARPAREGELLSFGVLPAYRGMSFRRETGRVIAVELFDRARAWFEAAGFTAMRAVVETDNREALLFYQAQDGCTFQASEVLARRTDVTIALGPAGDGDDA